MQTAPKVTVFIPVYNGEKYLRECLESILGQTYTDFECLLIDDGSSDNSAAIIHSFADPRIRYVKNERNIGIANTRNRAFQLAQGEYIAFIDCDDISVTTRLEKQVTFMDAHPEVGVCGSWLQEVYPNGEPIAGELRQYPTEDAAIKEMMFWNCPLWNPTLIFRKSIIQAHQLKHNPDFISASDFDLFIKASKVTQLANIPEVLLHYRRHENQITTSRTFEANRNASLLRASLILQEIKQHIPTVEYDIMEGVNMRHLTPAAYFEKLLRVDQLLAQLDQPDDPEKSAAYKRLKHYLDIIWFNSLFHLPRYEMPVYQLLRQSHFFQVLPPRTRLLYRVKSALGVKKEWIQQARSLIKGEKQLAWQ